MSMCHMHICYLYLCSNMRMCIQYYKQNMQQQSICACVLGSKIPYKKFSGVWLVRKTQKKKKKTLKNPRNHPNNLRKILGVPRWGFLFPRPASLQRQQPSDAFVPTKKPSGTRLPNEFLAFEMEKKMLTTVWGSMFVRFFAAMFGFFDSFLGPIAIFP